MRTLAVFLSIALLIGPVPVSAQDDQTLADIRQELSILYVEVQRLKRELSTTGSPNVQTGGGTALDRLAAIETELQRLTGKTEQLELRIDSVVRDGTNRIGDLEFRLVELEGGDVSQLGETTTLGGVEPVTQGSTSTTDETPSTELAVGERDDFERANEALASGDYQAAADQFAAFNQTYPGGPMAAQASLKRGQALSGLDNTRDAARAYLESFSTDPTGPTAPEALMQLGTALGKLEQKTEACTTLGEVSVRFPDAPAASSAQAEMQNLSCP